MTSEEIRQKVQEFVKSILDKIHGRGDRELRDLWLAELKPVSAAFAESLSSGAAAPSGGAQPCTHCHMPLEVCQRETWQHEVINRTRVNWRFDEEAKVFVGEFPRMLTQAGTKEHLVRALKSMVRMQSYLFLTGEFPPESAGAAPPAASPQPAQPSDWSRKAATAIRTEVQNHLHGAGIIPADFVIESIILEHIARAASGSGTATQPFEICGEIPPWGNKDDACTWEKGHPEGWHEGSDRPRIGTSTRPSAPRLKTAEETDIINEGNNE